MASITIETLWISDAISPNLAYPMPLASLKWKPSKDGGVRTYGGGRRRLVTRKGTRRQADVDLSFCDRVTVNRLEAWVGKLLYFRDPMGRKIFGVFMDLDIEEIDGADGASVSFTITEVTYSLEV